MLFNELDSLLTGVDVWFWDAQFSEEGDCRLALAKLVFIMCVVLRMYVDLSNHRLNLVVLLE